MKLRLHLILDFITRDLKKVLCDPSTQMTHNDVRNILQQILLAVAFCHERGILHRDLKPSNVLIDQHGVVKLCDFGLARGEANPNRDLTREVGIFCST